MLLTGSELRVLQIHPTRRCNLRCLHCYSSSAPEQRGTLSASVLGPAIEEAAQLGYNMLSVSGGEPLLYPELAVLLRLGRERGMLTALITNGILLTPHKLAEIGKQTDLIAISLDGAPARHNQMRDARTAFEQMQSRLAGLRETQVAFGFVFTLTDENLAELEWAAKFAADEGAVMLQVHPLQRVGRGASISGASTPSADDAGRAWLILQRLRQLYYGQMDITFDLVPPEQASKAAHTLIGENVDLEAGQLGRRLSPLVIEADGMVVPLQYGFSRDYALGDIQQMSLSDLAADWLTRCGPAFSRLSRSVANRLMNSGDLFVDPYGEISAEAEARAGTVLGPLAEAASGARHFPVRTVLATVAPEARAVGA